MELIHLKKPIHIPGLSLISSGLPQTFESLGRLSDRFHAEVLGKLTGAVHPAVETGVSINEKDYLAGGQTVFPGQSPGLTGFTIPSEEYVKGSFSAHTFDELADSQLQTIWEDMLAWMREQELAAGDMGIEIYPQETVSLPRPEMYCLFPIKPKLS